MEDGSASAPYIVICEGSADRAFLMRLMQVRWGVTDVSVRCTHVDSSPYRCAGMDGLKQTLQALDAVRATVAGSVRGIAIMFDGDEDQDKRFQEILTVLKESKLGYPRPAKLREVVKGTPSVAINLLPIHLDQLIFDALQTSHGDLLQAVADFENATSHRTAPWRSGAKSKMRLRCLIAASHEKDPSIALSYLIETSKCPIDFNHQCFDDLITFIEDFRRQA